jgi:general secretion pathway protein B
MSFILEALKKSDKKRQDGAVPNLKTVHAQAEGSRGRRRPWVLLLALALLGNAVLLIWLFYSWQQPQPQALALAKPQSQLEATVPAAPARPAPAAEKQVARPSRDEAEELLASTRSRRATKVATAISQQQETVVAAAEPRAAVTSSQSEPARPAQVVPTAERIYRLAELPLAVRGKIPELHMSLHAYSRTSPAASLVRINDQILREGMQLDKLLLDKITAEGAVLRIEGYRFLLPRR